MPDSLDDLCPRPDFLPPLSTQPVSPPIYTSAVYRCESPQQAARLLAGDEQGYVYGRDGHPNGDILAEKVRALHAAERAIICSSGMAALSVATLALLQHGDHVVISDKLYGRTAQLLNAEAGRFGVTCTSVDTCDLPATAAAIGSNTRLVVVETISNPLVRVCDLPAMGDLCRQRGARLLVDNTFASPALCRPLENGADLAVESLTKIMSGHSDVVLGALCGRDADWSRVPLATSCWGLSASPFDCWLALRGIGTLALRVERTCANALAAARFLQTDSRVEAVHYPGLAEHPEHALATRLLGGRYGSIVAFTLRGGAAAAESFIRAARDTIPFCPSLGDLSTTLSHPASTSHRAVARLEREAQGIKDGTIRLSVGIESESAVVSALRDSLGALP